MRCIDRTIRTHMRHQTPTDKNNNKNICKLEGNTYLVFLYQTTPETQHPGPPTAMVLHYKRAWSDYWVELTGLTNVNLIFLDVEKAVELPRHVPIVEYGARRKANTFGFHVEAGQAEHLLNSVRDRGLPAWFDETIVGALRVPPAFAVLVAEGRFDAIGIPLFDDDMQQHEPGKCFRQFGWKLSLEAIGLNSDAIPKHSGAAKEELQAAKGMKDEANLFEAVLVRQMVADLQAIVPSAEEDASDHAQRLRSYIVRLQRHGQELSIMQKGQGVAGKRNYTHRFQYLVDVVMLSDCFRSTERLALMLKNVMRIVLPRTARNEIPFGFLSARHCFLTKS